MRKIRLTESEFMKVIVNSVKRTLNEDYHFDNFSSAMDEDGIDGQETEDTNSPVIDILRAKEEDYDMLAHPEVEDVTIEELAQCIEDILEQAENGGPISSTVGNNTITITDDTLYLESEETGEESHEQWASDIVELISGEDVSDNLDYIVDTIAASINQCWFDVHEDEIDDEEGYDDDMF